SHAMDVGPVAQERHIVGLAVEGDEALEPARGLVECREQRRLLAIVPGEILAQDEIAPVPVHGPGQEDRARREAAGLEVEEQDTLESQRARGDQVGLLGGSLAELTPVSARAFDLGPQALVHEDRPALVAPFAAGEEGFDAGEVSARAKNLNIGGAGRGPETLRRHVRLRILLRLTAPRLAPPSL